jgi:hypothetical protein
MYKITTKIIQFFEECSSIKNQTKKYLFSMLQYATINVYYNMKIKSYKKVFILLEINF